MDSSPIPFFPATLKNARLWHGSCPEDGCRLSTDVLSGLFYNPGWNLTFSQRSSLKVFRLKHLLCDHLIGLNFYQLVTI